MALVDKKVKDFSLTAFKAGEEDFFQVSRKDIEGKWSVFLSADFNNLCIELLRAPVIFSKSLNRGPR